MFAIGCKQVSNGGGQNPDSPIETNEITITVNGDEGVEVKKPNSFKVKKSSTWKGIKQKAIEKIKAKENKEIKEWRIKDEKGVVLKDTDVFEKDTIVFAVSKDKENPTPPENPIIITIEADAGYTFKESKKPCTIEVQKGSAWTSIKTQAEARIELVKDYESAGWKLGGKDGSYIEDTYAFSVNATIYATSKKKGEPETPKITITVNGDEEVEIGSPNNFTVDSGSKWAGIKTQAEEKAKAKECYEIEAWHLNNAGGTLINDETEFKENATVFAVSKRIIAQYRVEHLKENIENDEFIVKETEEKQGEAGKNTLAEVKQYEGFKCQGLAQSIIKADGSTVVQIKYKRNRVSLVLDLDGGSTTTTLKDGESGKKLLKGKFEAKVEVKGLEKENHSFKKWEPALPELFPKENDGEIYVSKWEEAICVKIKGDERVEVLGSENFYVSSGKTFEDVKNKIEEKVKLKEDWSSEDYYFYDWKVNEYEGEKITDATPIEDGMTLYARTNYRHISFSGTRLIECNSSVEGRIIIPTNVTEIKERAFSYCRELTAIDFSGCTKLTEINGFEGDPSNSHNFTLSSLRYLNFTDCTGLKSIYRGDFVNGHKTDNYNVPDYQLLTFNLSGCSNLEQVYGSWYSYDAAPMIIKPLSLDANITSFTIKDCTLEGLDLTSSKNLSKLEIKSVDFESVVDFSSLTELTEICVRSCKTNQSFMVDLKNCTKLKRIEQDGFSGSSQISVRLPNTIEKIDPGAFGRYNKNYCYSVKVPNYSIKNLVVNSGYNADWVLMY